MATTTLLEISCRGSYMLDSSVTISAFIYKDEWTFPSLSFGWIHFHFRGSRSDFSFLFCILLHITRQWNHTVCHGGDTDVPELRRYRPDAVPVETRLLPASSRFITVFDSLPGYSR